MAHWLEEDDFRNNGVMNHEMVDGIQKRRKPFYSGLHWVWLGYDQETGVFEDEKIKYLGSSLKCRHSNLELSRYVW